MNKVLYLMGGAINRLAYVRLIATEVLDEFRYATLGDSIRGIISAAEARENAHKLERRTFSRGNSRAGAAHNLRAS